MHRIAERILLDEGGLIAVDKPAGLPSTGRSLGDRDCLQGLLMEWTGRMVWAVHQLDTDTSGVNLFVRRKSLVATVASRLRPPGGLKVYWAVCHGEPAFERLAVDAPIGRARDGATDRLGVRSDGRPASSRIRVLARAPGFCLLELHLLTGRTHQARIHLAHAGHPLVGERRYRHPPCELHRRHALHAVRVVLGGPEPRVVDAPVASELMELGSRLGLDVARDAFSSSSRR